MYRKKIVVLTGAGISAESGLKTFRDGGDGLWNNFSIEDVATRTAWNRNPSLVLAFYNARRREIKDAKPNLAHIALTELETKFDFTIITQNIDDLHERAGSTQVMHLHGEIFKMRSERNNFKTFPIFSDINLGDKALDGGQYRPHIVWFQEPVPMIEAAIPLMQSADIFLLIGSSLAVYPAAGLIDYVDDEVEKYVIDKKIPPTKRYRNTINIEQPATIGTPLIVSQLLSS